MPRGWVAVVLAVVILGIGAPLVLAELPVSRWVMRLYSDRELLRHTVQEWGVLAPVVFVAIQALQVVIAPIPGDVTGFLGGFLFGQWPGFFYSTIGLTLGSLLAFGVGRALGRRVVHRLVDERVWTRLGFIVEAEGTLLCFVIYLIPGLPKDIICYLFGLSPLPFWVFALASTLGRMPGTWVLSAEGAQVATGRYVELLLLTAVTVMIALPLYYHRNRIVAWVRANMV